jgi:hypothetical protein
MALFHRATLTPTKAELLAAWAPTNAWGPPAGEPLEIIGSYRFDDPQGRVGMETFLFTSGGTLLQAALTYRDEPLDDPRCPLVATMEHSALGTRHVYEGVRDPRYVPMLAGCALTGQGEALGMVELEGRWVIAPTGVRIEGGGWGGGRVAVDGFEIVDEGTTTTLLRNDRFELAFHHRPVAGDRPALGLVATWDGCSGPVVAAEVREL